eukprot:CAMPEP_0115835948 /NCGR_PEP_ID=MMETSP0287-20121206/4458_1 /TAXON_ID=412157 /ORGANISM="Chrysochromulina rotalis, Strain UIO044" /LENGTH=898 /DNA_ID=CAMNT_0003289423 /DNA_START=1 /DNA_END=2697 /DNA_ORIENTATION=-
MESPGRKSDLEAQLAEALARNASLEEKVERLSRSASPRSPSPRPFSKMPDGLPKKSPRSVSPRPRSASPRGTRGGSAFGSTTKKQVPSFFTASMRGGPLMEPLPQRGLTERERMDPKRACRGPSLLYRDKYGAPKSEWERFNSPDLDTVNFLEDDNPFNDPFKYHPFKGMAFPPTDYIGPDDARETDDLQRLQPANALRLKFVHGYTARNGLLPVSRNNLFYNKDGRIIYHAAALGIVYDKGTHEQWHFHGHDDDICSLDMNPKDRVTIVTGQLGKDPKILVWSSRPDKGSKSLPLLCVINGDHKRAVIGLSFSSNGEFIGSVGFDNNRSIALYRWGKDKTMEKMRIGTDKGHTDDVWQVAFNPVTNHVVAGGKKMLRFFGLKEGAMNDTEKDARAAAKSGQTHTPTLSDSESKIWAKKGTFGADRGAQDILSLAFDGNGFTYAGSGQGVIFRFKEQATDLDVKAHPLAENSSGWPASWSFCRVTALWFCPTKQVLISSGDDGWLHQWDPSKWDETAKGKIKPIKSFDLNKWVLSELQGTIVKMDDKEFDKADPNRGRPAAALSLYGDGTTLLVGTMCNEIYEVAMTFDAASAPMCLMQGHFDELWGLAMHPTKLEFVTASEDKTLRVWDMDSQTISSIAALPGPSRCACYSPNGLWIAVGLGGGDKDCRQNGKWLVLDSKDLSTVFEPPQARFERCCDIKFSPDCRWIAIANADNGIDIYSVPGSDDKGWRRVAKFEGHSSFVCHIDWSEDSMKLQSNCGAHELLYWKLYDETKTSFRWRPHQEKSSSSMRDEKWSTQTCIYGWPVRGVWPEGADGTDINGMARSNTGDREMLVTSDDFGRVKLFRYPCIVPYAGHKPYSGHSSHVTNIAFACSDRWVCSTGGEDCAVFQWEVVRER